MRRYNGLKLTWVVEFGKKIEKRRKVIIDYNNLYKINLVVKNMIYRRRAAEEGYIDRVVGEANFYVMDVKSMIDVNEGIRERNPVDEIIAHARVSSLEEDVCDADYTFPGEPLDFD